MINIAVSGINTTDNPGPGIPFLRSLNLSSLDFSGIGLSYDMYDPGHYLPEINKSYLLSPPSHGWESLQKRLGEIQKENGLDVVIPCLDVELPLYIKNQDNLEKMNIKTFLPSFEQYCYRDKVNLDSVAKDIGLSYPKSLKVSSIEELRSKISKLNFPLMVKGPYYKAYKARSIVEAEFYFNKLFAEWGGPIILQEIVYGDEVNLLGVGDGEGSHFGFVSLKKQVVTELGKIWTGLSIKNNDLEKAAEKFVSKVNWRGPFELECILSDNQELYLIEINPRFPAWVYFSGLIGTNLPERLIKKLINMPFDRSSNEVAGKVFMRYSGEVMVDITDISKLRARG